VAGLEELNEKGVTWARGRGGLARPWPSSKPLFVNVLYSCTPSLVVSRPIPRELVDNVGRPQLSSSGAGSSGAVSRHGRIAGGATSHVDGHKREE
jgi:hypothetical protein